MAEFSGAELKKKREEMHIPLEQVASETRIRLSILQDLEDEEYSELSSSAQIKGFLRIYADYLGISAEMSPAPEDGLVEDEKLEPPEAEPLTTDTSTMPKPEPELKPEKSPIDKSDTPEIPVSEISKEPTKLQEEPAEPKPESESQKMLAQLGRELSARRRYLNLDWDVIVQQTRLHRNTLRALENGDLEAFFAPLEFRKDLQTYARFLNLNVESIMIQYAEALQKRRFEHMPKKRLVRDPSKPASRILLTIRRFFTLDLLFGTFIVLGILVFLIWGISNMRQRTEVEPSVTETLPAIIDFILSTPTQNEPTIEATPEETEEALTIPTATAFFIQNAPEEGYSLALKARQNLWLRVYTDDKLAYVGRLAIGEVKNFSAKSNLSLETSNIANLEIAFQGTALEFFDRPVGTAARLLFDQAGMQELPVFDSSTSPNLTPNPVQETPGAP